MIANTLHLSDTLIEGVLLGVPAASF